MPFSFHSSLYSLHISFSLSLFSSFDFLYSISLYSLQPFLSSDTRASVNDLCFFSFTFSLSSISPSNPSTLLHASLLFSPLRSSARGRGGTFGYRTKVYLSLFVVHWLMRSRGHDGGYLVRKISFVSGKVSCVGFLCVDVLVS